MKQSIEAIVFSGLIILAGVYSPSNGVDSDIQISPDDMLKKFFLIVLFITLLLLIVKLLSVQNYPSDNESGDQDNE